MKRLHRALFPLATLIFSASCTGEPPGLTRDYETVKAEFVRVCTGCHSLDPIMKRSLTLEEWRKTVARMQVRGAKLEDWMVEDFPRHLEKIRPAR